MVPGGIKSSDQETAKIKGRFQSYRDGNIIKRAKNEHTILQEFKPRKPRSNIAQQKLLDLAG